MDSSALVDPSKFSQLAMSDSERKDRIRDLVTKQTYEAAKLESDLRKEEIGEIDGTIHEFEAQKQAMREDLKKDMMAKLAKAKTDAEREKLILDHANNMAKMTDNLEKQKQQQLTELRKKLLDRRRQAKKNLHKTHLAEAKSQGLPPDIVPDMTIPAHEKLDADLRNLTAQEEKLKADLSRTEAEEAGKDKPVFDAEMEARLRALHIVDDHKEVLIGSMRKQAEDQQRRALSLKEKLRARKDRNKKRTIQDAALLGEEGKQLAEAGADAQLEADRVNEENALMEALKLLEEDTARRSQAKLLEEATVSCSEEERRRILEQFEDEQLAAGLRRDEQLNKQRDNLLAKLAARKRMKEELNKEQAVAAELDRITQAQASKGDPEVAAVVADISGQLSGAVLSSEQQDQQEAQTARQADLEARQREQQRRLEEELTTQKHGEGRSIDATIDAQHKLAVDEHKAKFDREMLMKGKNLSEAEFEALMKKHREELAKLELNMAREKEARKKALDQKLADRKRARAARLAEKHGLELATELNTQQQERDKLGEKIAREVETTKLTQGLKDKDAESAENMIYSVLRQRHTKEAVHLEEQLARSRATRLAEARSEVLDKRATEREKLQAAFDQEMSDLITDSAGLSPAELESRKLELTKRQETQMSKFDALTEQLVTRILRDLEPQLEVEGIHARLDLKERHLEEIARTMRDLNPEQALVEQYAANAKRAAEEAENYRKNTLEAMRAELQRKKEEARLRDEERKRKLAEELKRLEDEVETTRKREEEREKQREAEREEARRRQLEDKQKREREEIQNSASSEEERDRLLREHEENLAKFDASLKAEQERSKKALRAKLDARRARRQAAGAAQLEKDFILEEDTEQQKLLLEAMKDDAERQAAESRSAKGTGKSTPGSMLASTGNAEEDWVNLLMASPLFQQIQDIQDLIDKSAAAGGGPGSDKVLGGDYSRTYIDVKDAQWLCEGDLTPADINYISPSQFVVYRFGVFIIRLLHKTIGTPEVTLLLANNLPSNNYDNNCFRHSFFYERARRILFVRRERMESIGDFILVILHCLAHIHADDLVNDSNPIFLRTFYKALRHICQDMFFSRTRSCATTQSLLHTTPGGSTRAALESAFHVARNQDERSNVTGELLDVKVTLPTEAEFSEQAITDRQAGYQRFASQAQMRDMLASQGGYKVQSDFVAARIAELKGQQPPTATAPKQAPRAKAISSQRDLLLSQLTDMEGKLDTLNTELTQVLKQESDLKEALSKLPAERQSQTTEQLTNLQLKRQNLLKRISHQETDIAGKRSESLKAK